ncbi:hypothetical protein AALP_AA7G025800 [Arabis alpina]|uniref:RING-type domain-containing protein n=1 Tax=Arabis alpina TaxID=50452 RepID=A0A087GFI8_ARAAL|nr:hypothetical protein AALP_AA7G025800 [Arabis alpina]
MEMASSEVEMSSCQTFNCVLTHQHNHNKKKNNNNNVRHLHVAASFEKNLNVFVRDHLDNSIISGDDSSKSVHECSVSDHPLSKTEDFSDPDPNILNPGQQGNTSRKETRAASSLVQIWEARTTQQPPSSNQSQIDSRTSSSGSNVLENSESLNEESIKELIQPIEEGNNEEEEEEEMECDSSQVVPPLPPEKEGVRVMDIIRKLSNDSETTTNNDNGSNNNDNSKEVQTTEVRCFPQVACSPRIRGRQAFADLLVQMTRDREKELAGLLERHTVSKFTHRGRIQSTLRIRCYERCIAIQDRHRCKSSAGSDLNRSPRGSGVMQHLRGKYKTNTENIETGASSSSVSSRGRHLDKDAQKATEKKVLQETMEKSDIKEIKEVIPAVENAKKAVLSESVENKNGLKKSARETIPKETTEGRGEKRDTKEKGIVKESLEWRGKKGETKEEAIAKEGEKRETKEKSIAKESLEGRGDKRETKEKAISKESGNPLIGIAEKVNRWNSEEKINGRRGIENGKAEGKGNTERVEKSDVLEEATKRSNTTSKEVMSLETKSKEIEDRNINPQEESNWKIVFAEKVVRRKKKEDCVSVETKSKEIKDRNINPQEVTAQAEEKVLKEIIAKSDSKKPVEKESRETGENVEEGNSLMGIAEKVNLWNSKEKKNKRRAIGKTEVKANNEINQILQEASRRITNVETAERSITTSRETVKKVVGNNEMMDRRECSGDVASTEAKSKEIIQDKNMNTQEVTHAKESASHGSRERAEEKKSSQHGEESILCNSVAKSAKEIERNNSQEEEITSDGSREKKAKEKIALVAEEMLIRNSEAMSTKDIDRNTSQDFTQEASTSDGSKEKAKEKISSLVEEFLSLRNSNGDNGIKESEDEETKKVECKENGENVKETTVEFFNDWVEEEEEEEEEYGDYYHYNGEDMYDWINDISRPRSYWEDLRKERYLEVLNEESEKKDICKLIESRTVSNFLTSDLRQKIDNLMITRVYGHVGAQTNQEEENEDEEGQEQEQEWEVEWSATNQIDIETEEEPEKTNLEATSDVCSQSSSWSFRDQDHEPTTSLSVPESPVPTNQSTQEMQIISDLRGKMEQLQREMFELRNTVKSCIDMQLHYQKSVTQDFTRPGSSAEQRVDTKNDPLNRKCCICLEMPVDSLLYRCGHMCTCLKCAHELQWSSKKCPICMAPIVDVVRAFLDS